jgi:hypothetical protein
MAQRARKFGIQPARLDELEQAAARIGAAYDDRGGKLAPVLEHHSGDRAVAHHDAQHFGTPQLHSGKSP